MGSTSVKYFKALYFTNLLSTMKLNPLKIFSYTVVSLEAAHANKMSVPWEKFFFNEYNNCPSNFQNRNFALWFAILCYSGYFEQGR